MHIIPISPKPPPEVPLGPVCEMLLLTTRPRLLVAEDDAEMRRLLVASLRKDGYDVVEARDGRELLERMADGHVAGADPCFDMIIADNRMPGLSGLEVLGQLRRWGYRGPVVLITAFGDGAFHEEARRLGVTAVFDKPFHLTSLRSYVRDALRPA